MTYEMKNIITHSMSQWQTYCVCYPLHLDQPLSWAFPNQFLVPSYRKHLEWRPAKLHVTRNLSFMRCFRHLQKSLVTKQPRSKFSITLNRKVRGHLHLNNKRRDDAGVNGKLMAKGAKWKLNFLFLFSISFPQRPGEGCGPRLVVRTNAPGRVLLLAVADARQPSNCWWSLGRQFSRDDNTIPYHEWLLHFGIQSLHRFPLRLIKHRTNMSSFLSNENMHLWNIPT